MLKFPNKIAKNDASKAGNLAARKAFFGDYSRFAVAPVHSRRGALSWFVWDADCLDEDGHATVIRMEDTFEEAVAGLE